MATIGSDLKAAADWLRQGALVAIPTETVYGLAANALDATAVARIFEVKNRPFFDPLIVHVASLEQATPFIKEVPLLAKEICQAFWPGPLTLVFEKTELIPDLVTSGHTSVALRVPSHPLTLELLSLINFPLAAPSANVFGYVSPTTAQHVQDGLGAKIPYILDGGPCKVGVESTIIRVQGSSIEVLRLGGTALEDLKQFSSHIVEKVHQNSDPLAPGQLDKHYAPNTKFLLDFKHTESLPSHLNIGYLHFKKSNMPSTPAENNFYLSPEGDFREAASTLFKVMREMDALQFDLILAESLPDIGLGRAINDRLRRAAVRESI
jgi:L-threonylcarbamoyladenylate synthase